MIGPDPFQHIYTFGDRAVRIGLVAGAIVALALHGAATADALTALTDLSRWVAHSRTEIRAYLWETYEVVDAPKPEEKEKPEEPEPEPEPEPEIEIEEPEPIEPPPEAPPEAPPEELYDEPPPPAPAEAAKVLTAPDEPEMLDFTDDAFVSGDGDLPTYGQVSAQGTAKKPTYNPAAKAGGTPGGTGTGPAGAGPPPAKAKDLSQPATLSGSSSWNCAFPPEADTEQIDQAVAVVIVTVRPDGTPQAVQVVSDPGHGFGRAARLCALGRRYKAGLDASGKATTTSTPPIRVRFTR